MCFRIRMTLFLWYLQCFVNVPVSYGIYSVSKHDVLWYLAYILRCVRYCFRQRFVPLFV